MEKRNVKNFVYVSAAWMGEVISFLYLMICKRRCGNIRLKILQIGLIYYHKHWLIFRQKNIAKTISRQWPSLWWKKYLLLQITIVSQLVDNLWLRIIGKEMICLAIGIIFAFYNMIIRWWRNCASSWSIWYGWQSCIYAQ